MARRDFVTADCHFGHAGVTKFLQEDGTKLRPWDTIEEMNEALISYWNDVVRDVDTVYVLGDFCLRRSALPLAARLNGRKILVKGNHDTCRLSEYAKYFDDIRACQVWSKAIGTHIPVHPEQLGRFKHNIHGHLHAHSVMYKDAHQTFPDQNYTCVSVEQTNWRPVELLSILDNI